MERWLTRQDRNLGKLTAEFALAGLEWVEEEDYADDPGTEHTRGCALDSGARETLPTHRATAVDARHFQIPRRIWLWNEHKRIGHQPDLKASILRQGDPESGFWCDLGMDINSPGQLGQHTSDGAIGTLLQFACAVLPVSVGISCLAPSDGMPELQLQSRWCLPEESLISSKGIERPDSPPHPIEHVDRITEAWL